MRALVYGAQGLALEHDHPQPQPGEGEALIRIMQAGICNTDLEITRGYKGFQGVLGHEFVGVVEAIQGLDARGQYSHLLGQRVVGEINIPCRGAQCWYCRQGIYSHCPRRAALGIVGRDGAFADYLTLPVENLHLVSDEVCDEEAVFVEPLAANFEMLEQVHITPGMRMLVLGDGKMGQLAAQVLALSGGEVWMTGKHEEKLALARKRGIVTHTVAETERLVQEGERLDLLVECTGSEQSLDMALRLVRPRGTIVLKSTVAEKGALDLSRIVVNEIRVQGSRCGPFEPALRALRQKHIDVGPLVSVRYAFEDAVEAFRQAEQKGMLKILLKMH